MYYDLYSSIKPIKWYCSTSDGSHDHCLRAADHPMPSVLMTAESIWRGWNFLWQAGGGESVIMPLKPTSPNLNYRNSLLDIHSSAGLDHDLSYKVLVLPPPKTWTSLILTAANSQCLGPSFQVLVFKWGSRRGLHLHHQLCGCAVLNSPLLCQLCLVPVSMAAFICAFFGCLAATGGETHDPWHTQDGMIRKWARYVPVWFQASAARAVMLPNSCRTVKVFCVRESDGSRSPSVRPTGRSERSRRSCRFTGNIWWNSSV